MPETAIVGAGVGLCVALAGPLWRSLWER
jgi:hypothetical protein